LSLASSLRDGLFMSGVCRCVNVLLQGCIQPIAVLGELADDGAMASRARVEHQPV